MLAKRKLNHTEDKDEKAEQRRILQEKALERRRILKLGYVLPNKNDSENEETLRKIALKGGRVHL